MKKLLAVCVLMPCLALAAPPRSEPQAATFQTMCLNIQDLSETVAEFEELPYVRGISNPLAQEGARLSLVIFVNPKTGTFTIVERTQAGLYCILAVGSNFQPVPKEVQDDVKQQQDKGRL